MKKVLITGITGQDGSYLAELLLDKGYEVHGIVRRVALEDPIHRLSRINHILDKLKLHSGSIESYSRMIDIFEDVKPDECYHLASQSFVHESFEDGFSTMNINIGGTLNVLSALKKRAPSCKFYFAASSEMFGKVKESPQNENTPFHPRSPYGISKVAGFDLTRNYREAYGIFACSGVLFNHESPRRGFEFVTRKISSSLAKTKSGKTNLMILGNLDAKRDWGYSKDYVEAMWMMLQQDAPDDYVVCSGKIYSIRDFLDVAFGHVGINFKVIDLHNLNEEKANVEVEKLRQRGDEVFVVQHPRFYRPVEVDLLVGDYSKVKKELGWKPKVGFEELVRMMVDSDLKLNGFG